MSTTDQIHVGTETEPQGSLCIFVGGLPYSLIVMPLSESAECLVQYRISKIGGQSYTVTVDIDGQVYCDCPSFIYRKHQIDPKGCKHCVSLRNSNLLNLRWNQIWNPSNLLMSSPTTSFVTSSDGTSRTGSAL